MTSHDDEEMINFSKLEKESLKAFEADAKYWRENDAKIRAVQNKVASYEEFKDLVLASHLRPLERGDKVSATFYQPWNTTAEKSTSNNTDNHEVDVEDHIKKDTTKFPRNGQEFLRDWRRYYKTTVERCAFLLYIGHEKLGQIFKAEIGFGLLGDFVEAFLCASVEEMEKVFWSLSSLSKVNRFSLSLQFLSLKEKENCSKLFKKIQENICTSDTTGITLEQLTELSKLYAVTLGS